MTIPHQSETSVQSPPPPKKKKRWGLRFLTLLLVLVGLLALYTFFVLTWSYSDGERAGALRKFSRKGWLCKTYEGELVLEPVNVANPVLWDFTVRDERVVEQLNQAVGKRVQLHYTEHKGIPTTCFGETGFFVDEVKVVGESVLPGIVPTP